MSVTKLNGTRLDRAKRAFSTRRAPPECMRTLIGGNSRPLPGDLVLARVDELGKQTKLELTDGRRAHMFPGDEIVVSFGNRYASDQYEAVVGPDMSPCDLVAAGGIAGVEISRHQRMLPPTKITPIGLIGDAEGRRLNLMRFRVEAGEHLPEIPAILSLGTSMNAGKTLTATSMVRGLRRLGYSVAALKITGTGAGGDMWIVRDAGADVSLDFTDAGFATTYLTPVPDIERATYLLMNHAASLGCEVAVIEIADGLQQIETAQLIRSEAIKRVTLGSVFAAYDAMGSKHGVDVLREAGHSVFALSGRLGRSPLGVREAEEATGLRVYTPYEMQEGALVPAIRELAAERLAAMGAPSPALERLAQATPPTGAAPDGPGGAATTAEGSRGRAGRPDAQLIELLHILKPAPDRARELLERVAARIMRAEVARLCGAPFGKRGRERTDRRNGFRRTVWKSGLGPVPVRVPRLRHARYRPSFLGPDGASRTLRPEDVDAVLSAGDRAGIEAAMSELVALIGDEPLDAAEMTALVGEVRGLLLTGASAPGAARAAPPEREWAGFDEDDDEETSHVAADFGASGLMAVVAATRELEADDDVSAGLAFQVPHVAART